MYVENLDMDNSVKWVPLNIVSGQITSNALWKNSKVRYFYWEFDYIFIPQTGRKLTIISYNIKNLKFRCTIISRDDHLTAGARADCDIIW